MVAKIDELSKEDRRILKEEYESLKPIYRSLKGELKLAPKDSMERYELACELSNLGYRIANIRKSLMDATFGHLYINNILERLIMGKESEPQMDSIKTSR